MEIIKFGENIELTRCKCPNCSSILLYTEYDIKEYFGNWKRTGVESSKRYRDEHIICPVCGTKTVLNSWYEEY